MGMYMEKIPWTLRRRSTVCGNFAVPLGERKIKVTQLGIKLLHNFVQLNTTTTTDNKVENLLMRKVDYDGLVGGARS